MTYYTISPTEKRYPTLAAAKADAEKLHDVWAETCGEPYRPLRVYGNDDDPGALTGFWIVAQLDAYGSWGDPSVFVAGATTRH